MRTARIARVTLAAVALLATASCNPAQFQFFRDNRVHITAPRENQLVGVPFAISWTWHGFTVTRPTEQVSGRAGQFGVFIDSAPPAPGRLLSSLFASDKACRQRPGCPGPADYRQRGIYLGGNGSVTISDRALLSSSSEPAQHTVTIVLLDGHGRRLGETAWFRDFRTGQGT
jgi:hypothetical protein